MRGRWIPPRAGRGPRAVPPVRLRGSGSPAAAPPSRGRRRLDPADIGGPCRNAPRSAAPFPGNARIPYAQFREPRVPAKEKTGARRPGPASLGWSSSSGLLLLQHRQLFGDLDIVDRYVHLGHPQARETLDAVDHISPRGLCDPGYRLAVLYGHRQVHGGLFLTDLDAHAPGEVPAARAASDALQEPT